MTAVAAGIHQFHQWNGQLIASSLDATCDHVTDLRQQNAKKRAAASAAAVAIIGGN